MTQLNHPTGFSRSRPVLPGMNFVHPRHSSTHSIHPLNYKGTRKIAWVPSFLCSWCPFFGVGTPFSVLSKGNQREIPSHEFLDFSGLGLEVAGKYQVWALFGGHTRAVSHLYQKSTPMFRAFCSGGVPHPQGRHQEEVRPGGCGWYLRNGMVQEMVGVFRCSTLVSFFSRGCCFPILVGGSRGTWVVGMTPGVVGNAWEPTIFQKTCGSPSTDLFMGE